MWSALLRRPCKVLRNGAVRETILLGRDATVCPSGFVAKGDLPRRFPHTNVVLQLTVNKMGRYVVRGRRVDMDNEGPFPFLFCLVNRKRDRRAMEFPLRHARDLRLLLRTVRFFMVLVVHVLTLCVNCHINETRANRHICVAIHVIAYRVAIIRPGGALRIGGKAGVFLGFRPIRLSIPIEQGRTFKNNRRHARTIAFSKATFGSGPRTVCVLSFRRFQLRHAAHGRVVLVKYGLRSPPIRLGIRRECAIDVR